MPCARCRGLEGKLVWDTDLLTLEKYIFLYKLPLYWYLTILLNLYLTYTRSGNDVIKTMFREVDGLKYPGRICGTNNRKLFATLVQIRDMLL